MGRNEAKKLQVASTIEAETKPTARSRITNGRELLPGVDGRSTWARRLRDLIGLHLSDLGGEGNASEAEKSIVRRASALTVELERLEAKFAQAESAIPADLDLYQRAANTLRRQLETLGIKRRQRDVTPDLKTYLANGNGGAR